MKNTEILIFKEQEKVIDWSIPMWAISDEVLVLTNGDHGSYEFSGTCLPCSVYPNGKFQELGIKDYLNR